MNMQKIKTAGDYDFYRDGDYFNIVIKGSAAPAGGYKSAAYILAIKGIAKFMDNQEAVNCFMKEGEK